MTEREKIVEIVLDTEITGIKLRNITGGISTANAIADALIEAGYGDVTEWKERAEKAEKEVATLNERAKRFKIVVPMGTTVNSFGSELYHTQPNPYGVKQLYSDEEVEQIVKERDSKEEAYNKCYFDYRYWKDKAKEYKHRAEIAERKYMIALNKYAKCDRKLTRYNKMTTTYDKEITKQAEREVEEEEAGDR